MPAIPPTLNEPLHPDTPEPGFRGLGGTPALITGSGPFDLAKLPGTLICLEGTAGVGRSTHVALLREWLENRGFGVVHTALATGRLTQEGLRRAKEGHTLGPLTMDLYYATDLADRLENHILPALRGGFVVLTDRYVYAAMARSVVRGSDESWVRDVYRFAPRPHATFYLKVDVEELVPRVLSSGGFDYWESGLDFQEERDVHRSFVRYQSKLIEQFDRFAGELGFVEIDAGGSEAETFATLRDRVTEALESRFRKPIGKATR